MSLEELFPLFCLSRASGLAIQEKNIGEIFSMSGLFFITIQYFLLVGFVTQLLRFFGNRCRRLIAAFVVTTLSATPRKTAWPS